MATDIYAVMRLFEDQQLLTEPMTIDAEANPDNKPVATMVKGFAGITPGAAVTNLSVDSAVPRTGAEVDWIKLAFDHTAVEMVVTIGVKQKVSKGFIMNSKVNGGIGKETTISCSFTGEPMKDL